MHEASVDNDGLDQEGCLKGEAEESPDGSELSPFLREMESPGSPADEGLTARDILEAHRMYEEGRQEFHIGKDVQAEPLGNVDLEMSSSANRQVRAGFKSSVHE